MGGGDQLVLEQLHRAPMNYDRLLSDVEDNGFSENLKEISKLF